MKLFFHSNSVGSFTQHEITDFEQILEHAYRDKGNIAYSSDFPKYRFLQYVATNKQMLLHGSNHKSISQYNNESMFKTWLLYKFRTSFVKK